MEVLSLIKEYKLPHSWIATRMGMNVNTFRKKLNGFSPFSEEELICLKEAIESYATAISTKLRVAA